jgi:zinc finger protein
LFTKIPFFKGILSLYKTNVYYIEIILSSFACSECGHKNTEVQFGGKLADFGIKYELKVVSAIHMNRQVVKSEFATIRIPELDLEIPPQTQKGSINTIEGFIQKTIEGLSEAQDQRREIAPEVAN